MSAPSALPAVPPRSTPAAAAPTSVRSAPSSTCRAASRAAARPTTSSTSCARTTQGLRAFFITDDNFARNKDWEPILDRIIHLREVEKFNVSFIIQVDTRCHKLPNFGEKAARAGVRRVFIGLENINPDNLLGAKKRQNKITEYRTMLLAWKKAGVITYAGYILGFPGDTYDSIMHDIDVIKRELPVDLLEFFYLTPLPGSEDHLKLRRAGAWLDPDLNKYDLNHICTPHPKMSREEWDRAYEEAWLSYYAIDHIEPLLRRVATRPLGRALHQAAPHLPAHQERPEPLRLHRPRHDAGAVGIDGRMYD